MRNLFLGSALLLVAACHQSTIQGDYKDISTACRSSAEDKVTAADSSAPNKSQAARNAELVTLFSDCMAKQGWAVATPKRAKAPAASEAATTKTTGPSDAGGKATTLTTPEPNKGNPVAKATEPLPGTPPLSTGTAPTYYQSTQPVTQPSGQPGYSIYQPAYPAPAAGTVPPAVTPPAPGVPQRY